MSLPRSRRSLAASLLSSLCLGVSMAACGPWEEPPGGDMKDAVQAQDTILAEIDVGYGTVRFHEFTSPDGNKMMAIEEQAPATLNKTPLDAIRQAPLTILE